MHQRRVLSCPFCISLQLARFKFAWNLTFLYSIIPRDKSISGEETGGCIKARDREAVAHERMVCRGLELRDQAPTDPADDLRQGHRPLPQDRWTGGRP